MRADEEARNQRVIEQYRAGVLVRRIAEAEDLDASHIHYILKKAGVEKNRKRGRVEGSKSKPVVAGKGFV